MNKNKILKNHFKLFDYFKLKKQYNAILIKYETLLNSVKDDCFNVIFSKINDDQSVVKLKKDNKMLRQQVKTLKELLKEECDFERDNSKKVWSKYSDRNKSRGRIKNK